MCSNGKIPKATNIKIYTEVYFTPNKGYDKNKEIVEIKRVCNPKIKKKG